MLSRQAARAGLLSRSTGYRLNIGAPRRFKDILCGTRHVSSLRARDDWPYRIGRVTLAAGVLGFALYGL
jgi:hypothetical protein